MLYPSRYNHLIEVKPQPGQQAHVLTNLFFGSACFVDDSIYGAFVDAERDGYLPESRLPGGAQSYFSGRGFLWDTPEAEETILQQAAHALSNRDQLAAGLRGGHYGFITSLYCNLACPYCFQQTHADSCGFLTPRQVDLGLQAIAEAEARATSLNQGQTTLPKISITGGEPLLRNQKNIEVLEYLLERLEVLSWPYSITTNGTQLARFVAERQPPPNCRNIQVTLDGPRPVHNQRRYYRNGSPSFDHICDGLQVALDAGWPMTLRVNLDMSNVEFLPELADFIAAQGWLEYSNFYAYVSPVTDHGSLGSYDVPKDEADLLEALLNVVERAPNIRKVFDVRHFRGFDYVERLLHKNPKYPVLFRCEAVMGMYIFDPHGDVHVCLEAVGDRTRRVGRYDPEWGMKQV